MVTDRSLGSMRPKFTPGAQPAVEIQMGTAGGEFFKKHSEENRKTSSLDIMGCSASVQHGAAAAMHAPPSAPTPQPPIAEVSAAVETRESPRPAKVVASPSMPTEAHAQAPPPPSPPASTTDRRTTFTDAESLQRDKQIERSWPAASLACPAQHRTAALPASSASSSSPTVSDMQWARVSGAPVLDPMHLRDQRVDFSVIENLVGSVVQPAERVAACSVIHGPAGAGKRFGLS